MSTRSPTHPPDLALAALRPLSCDAHFIVPAHPPTLPSLYIDKVIRDCPSSSPLAVDLQSKPRTTRTLWDAGEERNLELRHSAVACWYTSGENIRAAVQLFKERNTGSLPPNIARYIHTWVAAFQKQYSVHTPTSPGRPAKLKPEEAERAVEVLWRGFKALGQQRYYRTIEQAVHRSAELSAMCKKHEITPRTLLTHMMAVEPRCRRRLQAVKRLHTAENARQRREACQKLLGWPIDYLRRTFWIDAATIYIVPKSMKVLAPPGAQLVLTDDRLPTHSSKLQKLRFYICINAILGPVAIKFVTGTSEAEGDWLVSAGGTVVGGLAGRGMRVGRRLTQEQPNSLAATAGRRQSSTQSWCWVVACTAEWQHAYGCPSCPHLPSAGAAGACHCPAQCGRTACPARTAPLSPLPTHCCLSPPSPPTFSLLAAAAGCTPCRCCHASCT